MKKTNGYTRISELQSLLGDVSRSTIYRYSKSDKSFPKKYRVGPNVVAFKTSDVETYLMNRPEA